MEAWLRPSGAMGGAVGLTVRLSRVVAAHPRHAVLCACGLGLVAGGLGPAMVAAMAVGAVAIGVISMRPALIAFVAVAFLVSMAYSVWMVERLDRSDLRPLAGRPLTARGFVVSPVRADSGGSRRFVVDVSEGRLGDDRVLATREKLLVRTRSPAGLDLGVGGGVEVVGTVREPRNRPGGSFDWVGYLRRQGVNMEMEASAVRSVGGRRGGLLGFVDGIRRRSEAALVAGTTPAMGELARGMVLGQDEALPQRIQDDFRRSGLTHLTAVSGQNVALLVALALPAFGLLGFGLRGRLAGAICLIVLYVPLTGAGPSIVRAAAMGVAAAVAGLAGRPASRWYALILAGVFTLALNPLSWQDVGWQMSFAAVAGIFVASATLADSLRFLPRAVAQALAMTLAATIGTVPLQAMSFGAVSTTSALANLLAVPVSGPVLWLGAIACAVGQASASLAKPIGLANGVLLGFIAAVARAAGKPASAVADVALGRGIGPVLAFAAAGAVLLAIGWAGRSRWRRFVGPVVAAIAVAPAIATLAGAWPFVAQARQGAVTVTFMDVGQGDATLIRSPGGATILVDGGPEGAGLVEKLGRLGVKRLDLVVLTHPQDDHYGGLPEVVDRLRVDSFVDGGFGGDPRYLALRGLLRERGVQVARPRAGDVVSVRDTRIDVLAPSVDADASHVDDPNDLSYVVVMRIGAFDLLLSGDAESDVLSRLPVSSVDAMKVPHHGSADPGLPALLDRLDPRVAAIEVGDGNRFGHPHPETMRALLERVPCVGRTDRDGNVELEVDGGAFVQRSESGSRSCGSVG